MNEFRSRVVDRCQGFKAEDQESILQLDIIQDMMLNILDSSSHTCLSNYGTTVLNCYAENGFRLIRSDITAPPELDEFLEQYHSFLKDLD